MAKEKKQLVVLTSGFPFDDKEPFFENELAFLVKHFEKIILIPVDREQDGGLRPLHANCTVLSGVYLASQTSYFSKLRAVFRVDFIKELFEIIKNKDFKLTALTLKTAVASLARANKMARLIEQQIDLTDDTVFYSFWTDDAGISLALLKRKNPFLKCVTRAHGWDLYFTTNTNHYLPFRWLITSQLDRIVTDSKAGANYISKNWTNASQLEVSASQMGVKKQNVDLYFAASFVVVSCSNLVPVKRVHLLAEALYEVSKTKPLQWVHFGDGELMSDIKRQINDFQSTNFEVDLKGHVLNEEVLNWYRKNEASVFVNVSESEGIPVSVMEAMSFGIPVIATDVGGNREIVDASNGRLIPAQFELSELVEALMFFDNLSEEAFLSFRHQALKTQQERYQDAINYELLVDKLKH